MTKSPNEHEACLRLDHKFALLDIGLFAFIACLIASSRHAVAVKGSTTICLESHYVAMQYHIDSLSGYLVMEIPPVYAVWRY